MTFIKYLMQVSENQIRTLLFKDKRKEKYHKRRLLK
ncbi:hypothetical protein SAMN05444349_10297 [Bacteroides faecichinchillae]|uniref:Uncharacterized protein n=1 Tax=Bacteroides faecichinchillae TaxID=871325 RepID=A0A1M4TEF5_9BACE|nr:hypothetical protein SAMN05444349_10297 [Bacteroides faecichinchillae]